jgi:hypothetical protein
MCHTGLLHEFEERFARLRLHLSTCVLQTTVWIIFLDINTIWSVGECGRSQIFDTVLGTSWQCISDSILGSSRGPSPVWPLSLASAWSRDILYIHKHTISRHQSRQGYFSLQSNQNTVSLSRELTQLWSHNMLNAVLKLFPLAKCSDSSSVLHDIWYCGCVTSDLTDILNCV